MCRTLCLARYQNKVKRVFAIDGCWEQQWCVVFMIPVEQSRPALFSQNVSESCSVSKHKLARSWHAMSEVDHILYSHNLLNTKWYGDCFGDRFDHSKITCQLKWPLIHPRMGQSYPNWSSNPRSPETQAEAMITRPTDMVIRISCSESW